MRAIRRVPKGGKAGCARCRLPAGLILGVKLPGFADIVAQGSGHDDITVDLKGWEQGREGVRNPHRNARYPPEVVRLCPAGEWWRVRIARGFHLANRLKAAFCQGH